MHGALIDAELLARVYLAMTGGQAALLLDDDGSDLSNVVEHKAGYVRDPGLHLAVVQPSAKESAAHEAFLERMRTKGACLWPEND